jgi:GTPase SAR1 family protein
MPIIKHKIVFLGDQSVGKTSIITRFIYDSFEGSKTVHIYNYSANSRDWFSHKNDTALESDDKNAIMGYSRTIEI